MGLEDGWTVRGLMGSDVSRVITHHTQLSTDQPSFGFPFFGGFVEFVHNTKNIFLEKNPIILVHYSINSLSDDILKSAYFSTNLRMVRCDRGL